MHVHMERLKPVTMQCGTVRPRTPPPSLEQIVPLSKIIEIQRRHDERRKPARPQLEIHDDDDHDDRSQEQDRRPLVKEPERGVCIMSM